MTLSSLCVYCGSSSGRSPAFTRSARELGDLLGRSGITLVYGGARVGLMGTVADAALAAGGQVIGVIPRGLVSREVAHEGLTKCHVVASMHERKALMAQLSEAFIALPGGLGTFEELFEIWTWAQLGIHAKPMELLNTGGYYDQLLGFLDRSAAEGFVREDKRSLLEVADTPAGLLARLAAKPAASTEAWLSPEES
nr:TIGR00730 family Rossman fold protein [uncultured Holophaga sp.]